MGLRAISSVEKGLRPGWRTSQLSIQGGAVNGDPKARVTGEDGGKFVIGW